MSEIRSQVIPPLAVSRVIGLRDLASLWTHRRVLTSLARHDLRKPYAGTAAGVAWAVFTPIVQLLIFTAIFSLGLRLPLGGVPYIFGFAAAYVPWVLLSNAITGATGSILDHRHLVKRALFPVEIIPADPLLVHTLPHAILLAVTAVAWQIGGRAWGVRAPSRCLFLYMRVLRVDHRPAVPF